MYNYYLAMFVVFFEFRDSTQSKTPTQIVLVAPSVSVFVKERSITVVKRENGGRGKCHWQSVEWPQGGGCSKHVKGFQSCSNRSRLVFAKLLPLLLPPGKCSSCRSSPTSYFTIQYIYIILCFRAHHFDVTCPLRLFPLYSFELAFAQKSYGGEKK